MILTTYVDNICDLQMFYNLGFKKFLVEDPKYSILNEKENLNVDYIFLKRIFDEAKRLNVELIFNCDIIFHNKDLKDVDLFLNKIYNIGYRKLRIQDIGFAWHVISNFKNFNIELNTITGNYTSYAIDFFKKSFSKKLTAMVLNKEITYDNIKIIISKTSLNLEMQIHGPIQLFYTPRSLISHHEIKNKVEKKYGNFEVFISEKNKNNNPYRFYENRHGSFMFYNKTLCLLNEISLILESGIKSMLFDFRNSSKKVTKDIIELYNYRLKGKKHLQENQLIKNYYPNGTTHGFFYENNTDRNINKNRNHNNNFILIGKVLSILKDKYIVIEFYEKAIFGETLHVKTPNKKEFSFVFENIKNLRFDDITAVNQGDIISIPWKKNTLPNSLIYKLT